MRPLTANASYSRLSYFKNCPRAYKFKYLDKLKEPKRPTIEGQTETAAERGSRIHSLCEEVIKTPIKSTHSLPPELKKIAQTLKEVASVPESHRYTEQTWYFDDQWVEITEEQAKSEGYHILVIIDAFYLDPHDSEHAKLIDYKSGKRYGNEQKHQRQVLLYALAAFHKFPELNFITSELVYTDLGRVHRKAYNRNTVLAQHNYWDQQINRMRDEDDFEPNPNTSSCMFCSWGLEEHSNKWVNKSGDCIYSVTKQTYKDSPQPAKKVSGGRKKDRETIYDSLERNSDINLRNGRIEKKPYQIKLIKPEVQNIEMLKRNLNQTEDGENIIRRSGKDQAKRKNASRTASKVPRNDEEALKKRRLRESPNQFPESNKDFDLTN